MYSINFWGSHPDDENDDCWMGEQYATRAEAIKAFNTDPYELLQQWSAAHTAQRLAQAARDSGGDAAVIKLVRFGLLAQIDAEMEITAFIELDGPDVNEVKPNPYFDRKRAAREAREADQQWQRERAMEAGMLHGIDAYNDEMGY